MTPWYYRCPFTNWLMAKPWQWHYRVMYRAHRQGARHPRTGEWLAGGEPHGRISAAWHALIFPHVHHPSEREDR